MTHLWIRLKYVQRTTNWSESEQMRQIKIKQNKIYKINPKRKTEKIG